VKNAIRLLKYARKYWKYLIIAMIALVVITATQLYAPMVIRKMIAMITENDPELGRKALYSALILGVLYLIQAFCQYLRSYLTHYAAWHFVSDMRVRVYNHLQKLSLRYYHDKQTGQLMSRTSNDTSTLENLIAHSTPDLIVNVLLLIGVTIILFSINAVLAFLSLVTVPFIVIAATYFAKRVLPQFKCSQQAFAEFNAALHDNLQGIKEIQIFNQEEKENDKIHEKSRLHVKTVLRVLKLSAIYHPTIEFFSNIGVAIVIGFGGYFASLGRVPLEDIITFILYLNMFYHPISTLGRLNEDMQNALAGASRIFEVLDTESDVKEAANPVQLEKVEGTIKFENVSFHYIKGTDILKKINLEINPGEMIALVGPTGVGKTTLISLICRFYDPSEGRITIDGIDMKEVSLKSLRDNTSIVLQDVFLFNGTVAENIAYGAVNATMEEIINAAKLAHAHEFIVEMEQGYDSIIGERGIRLSGGQKQRISIARAILRNSPLIILDEATASVDMETEKLIHEAIDRVIQNRTTIIIAHRLSSIKKADKIVVLNEGRIEEMGTHYELLKNDGLYSKLYNIQFKEKEVS
jgi:ATP-binding cassette subfamily B protein